MGFLKLETKNEFIDLSPFSFMYHQPSRIFCTNSQSKGSQLIVLDRLYGYFTLDDDRHMSLLKPQIISRTLDSNRVKLATNRYHRAIVQSKNW